MLEIIHWLELTVGSGLVVAGFLCLDRIAKIPYVVYFLFYIMTSFIGGLIIYVAQSHAQLWDIIFFRIDSAALPSPLPERYFQLLVAPLLIVPTVVILLRWLFPVARSTDTIAVRADRDEFSAIILVAGASLLFCLADMLRGGVELTGYLTSAQTFIDFTGKMLARHSAFANMSKISISIIYTVLPMLAAGLAASIGSMRDRPTRRRHVLLMITLLVIVDIYLCTTIYIKSQIIVTGIYIVLALSIGRRVKVRHFIISGVVGVILLSILFYFLSFADGSMQGGVVLWLAVLTALYQIFFRMGLGLPFYACLFPSVLPYSGVAMGPDLLGLAPKFATNSAVFNYMMPLTDPAMQGHQPAPAHFSAYAGGGMAPALIWLVLIGIIIFLIGRFGRNVRTALGVGMLVVWCIYVYYATQTDLYGAFWASYGPVWGVLFYIICRGVQILIHAMRLTPWKDPTTRLSE